MDEEEETELSRVDSWMQSTVPSIPKYLALICLVLNIVIPGLGTFFGGIFSCCCGRPRIEFRPVQFRCPVAVLVMIIGILQFLATGLFLVGWLWSIIWGFLMVNLSGAEFRKMPPPPPVAPPPLGAAPQRRASKVSIQIEESAPPGKKNFSNLINKASENKELAVHGSDSTVSISKDPKDPKDSKNPKDSKDPKSSKSEAATGKLAPTELHSGKLSLPSPNSTPKASSSKLASSIPVSQGRTSTLESSSIFSCFSQKHKKFIAEKLEKFLMRSHSESTSDLLETVAADGQVPLGKVTFKSTAHRFFQHWRVQARKLARLRKVANLAKTEDESSPASIRDSAGTPNSVRFELPNAEADDPVPSSVILPVPQAADVQAVQQIILDPSKLASGRNNPTITVAKPLPDPVADERTQLQSSPTHEDMKPRIMHSQTYHFAA